MPAYSRVHTLTTCGADANAPQPEVLEFNFLARGLSLLNTCADPLYFTLTTDPASTTAASIPGSGGVFKTTHLCTPGISLLTTSTSTGLSLPLGRPRVSVVAWSA